ncbi:MAG: type II secretion system protein, partial [Polyangiales bacterium]
MPRARHPRAAVAGFSAVELCLLLSVVGIGAAAFVPTFVRQLRVSKIAEAATVLEDIEKRLHSYHQTERLRRGRSCLPDAAGPTPAQPHAEPVQVDFQRAGRPGAAVWRALGVQPAWPVRYRYSLQS